MKDAESPEAGDSCIVYNEISPRAKCCRDHRGGNPGEKMKVCALPCTH